MPYPIEQKLVVAVSSTALFDLAAEHDLYLSVGVDEFRAYQREHRSEIPDRGVAFPFIERLLHLNQIYEDEHPIEVVILSRNHADAGLRVMDAVSHYRLEISRSFFLAGQLPYPYMNSVNAVLYLSTNKEEVKTAVEKGYPAGYVLPCEAVPDDEDEQLRIAFDFDGVVASDEAEAVFNKSGNLDMFHEHERQFRNKPLQSGPLMPLLLRISEFQKLERQKAQNMAEYTQMLRIAIVTARNAPAHERMINTLAEAGIDADELFLLGGIEKKRVLDILKPHIFFDDQIRSFRTSFSIHALCSRTIRNRELWCISRRLETMAERKDEMMEYTAVVKKEGDWWVGWIEEIPGVNCQESTRHELLETLRVTLREALEFNRREARAAAGLEYEEERVAV